SLSNLLCTPSPCISFFFTRIASTTIYTLSLHDALPICKATLRKYNGVIGFVGYGSIQCILLGRRSRYRILLQRIGRKPLSPLQGDRKSTRLNSSHVSISYAVFCLKKKNTCITINIDAIA